MFQFQLADEARGAFMRVPLIDFQPGAGASFVIVYQQNGERESDHLREKERERKREREGESEWEYRLSK